MKKIKKTNFYEIQNLNGYYINKKGVVYSEKSGKELKSNNGVIEFYVDGSKKKMNVAHLVLETFVGNPQNANRVHYKNGDRNDASLGNVEWKTPSTTKKRAPQTNATTPRQKEISNEMKAANILAIETVAADPNASIDDAIQMAEESIQEAIELYNLSN